MSLSNDTRLAGRCRSWLCVETNADTWAEEGGARCSCPGGGTAVRLNAGREAAGLVLSGTRAEKEWLAARAAVDHACVLRALFSIEASTHSGWGRSWLLLKLQVRTGHGANGRAPRQKRPPGARAVVPRGGRGIVFRPARTRGGWLCTATT